MDKSERHVDLDPILYARERAAVLKYLFLNNRKLRERFETVCLKLKDESFESLSREEKTNATIDWCVYHLAWLEALSDISGVSAKECKARAANIDPEETSLSVVQLVMDDITRLEGIRLNLAEKKNEKE